MARATNTSDAVAALSALQDAFNTMAARLADLEHRIANTSDLVVLNRTGEVVARIGQWNRFEGAFFKNVMIGPSENNPQIYQDSSGDVFIDGDVIVDGSISASAFITNQPQPVGLTVTNNSPGAGSIAWNAHTIVYAGTSYSITGNNTSNTFVWWNVGNTSLSSGSSYTPQAARFLYLTNSSGTHDTAYNKNAAIGIVRDNLNFSLLEGMAIQPPAEVQVSMNGTGETTVLNVTGSAGVLLGVQVEQETGTNNNALVASIRFTIDGASAQDYALWNAGVFTAQMRALSDYQQIGNGGTNGDTWRKYIGIPFTTSCKVTVNRTVGDGVTRTVLARVEYALKV
jgi:hypothetical protein